MRFARKLLLWLSLIYSLSYADSSRSVKGKGLEDSDTAAINLNFDQIDAEFGNVVHKTSTETINGFKYFTNTVTVSTISASVVKIGGTNLTASSQSDEETGTSTTSYTSPLNQQYHKSSAKAWAIFVGSGTVNLVDNYNVSSITDNGTGDYTLNFTTSFSGQWYACAGMGQSDQGGSDGSGNVVVSIRRQNTTPVAGSLRIRTLDLDGTAVDASRVMVVCFGDQ